MDKRVETLMREISSELQNILKNNLVGIYIHGSLAFDCFSWENSDIDFIVVTQEEPDFIQKKQIIKLLLKIDGRAPSKGIECSFVLKKDCRDFVYPAPYQLHFSNAHKEKYINDIDSHIKAMHGTDKDLAAHFTVINNVGITFYGKDRKNVFSPVAEEFYMDSIKCDIENAVDEITDNPVYFVLNLCRVLAYKQEGAVLSKAGGGLWGISNIPQFKSIIEKAYRQYVYNETADFDSKMLTEFAQYMLDKIYNG